MRISVVIPHLNQPAALARCLASLAAGARAPDEIFVVDNGSTDLPTVPDDAILLKEPTPGPGPARNLGTAQATGDVLAFIDADCLADPAWLAAAEQAISSHDILGGDVRIAYSDPENLTELEAYESIYAYRMDRYIAREGFTGTGNLVVKSPVLETVGPFAGLGIAEDRDWGQRATAQGLYTTYIPQMRVYHPARTSFAELTLKWDRQIAHDYARATGFIGKLKWLLKICALPLSPLYELPRICVSDRLTRMGDRWKALKMLTRIRLYRAWRMAELLVTRNPERLSGKWNRV
jgi:glycosyltransferase involved in cell wall biosynthesis